MLFMCCLEAKIYSSCAQCRGNQLLWSPLKAQCLVQSWLLENGADCITCKWEVFGNGRVQGQLLSDKSWGCPVLDTASSRQVGQIQQIKAEPISHVCGTSMKIYLRECGKRWSEV